MGKEVFYCSRCRTRIISTDLEEGTAFRVRGRYACERCVGEMIASLPPQEQAAILRPTPRTDTIDPSEFFELDEGEPEEEEFFEVDEPNQPERPRRPAAAPRPTPAPSTGAPVATIFFLGVAVLLLCLAGLFYFFGSKPPPPQERAAAAARPPKAPPPPPETPKEAALRTLLEAARAHARANPSDLAGQIDRLKKVVAAAEGTPFAAEAGRELESARLRQKEALALDLEPVDRDVRAAIEKEEFKRAQDLLEAARKKHGLVDWTTAIDERIRDTSVAAWKVFLPIREKAVEAKRRGADAEIKPLAERVARWGLPGFVKELEKSIETPAAAAPPPPPEARPLSAEAKRYLPAWQQAMLSAARREYDEAGGIIARAAAGIQDADLKKEIQADQEILKQVEAFHREAVQALSRWPRGEKITLDFYNESLAADRVIEPFLRADDSVVEVTKGGGPVAYEVAEITACSLGRIYRGRPDAKPEEGRPAALFCLIEGDLDGARVHLASLPDTIPAKYWTHGGRGPEALAGGRQALQREIEARRIYFAADRELRDVRTRGAAVQGLRQLLNDYADTSIVKQRRAQITAKRDGAKEYLWKTEELEGTGTMRVSRYSKVGTCWTSQADSRRPDGAVEFRFYGFVDAPLRCWIYVGACCAETFAAYYQATGLTVPDPETKQAVAAEPGSGATAPLRHTITFLKKTHADHGGAKEPKRWEWIEVKLPKVASAGLKTVRILTDQKGFSVAFAVVSATRSYPPSDAEVKTWVRKPDEPEEPPVPPPPAPEPAAPEPRDPSLIGHWKLDEQARTALDASGNDNTGVVVNDPPAVAGKVGGALALNGADRYVELPNSATLDAVQNGSYTLACWFKPHAAPAGAGGYALLVKSALPVGLTYGSDRKFAMDHGVKAVSAAEQGPGTFYHVAGVVDRKEGTVRLYVDGKLEATGSLPAGSTAPAVGAEIWRIGIGPSLKLAADGTVDDVRIYSRPLAANEIQMLAGVKASK